MNRLPLVYLGPSLPLTRAQALLDADYRPPVKRGDLPQRHDGTIVIIDGEFGQNLSVSPKEILRLLDRGTRVIGASSMGALRAAELSVYGMQGCGWVFDAYQSGRVDADDEVAVAYSPDDLSCLTVPLVNVRHWLDVLLAARAIDAVTARRLLKGARQLFYADRSEERLLAKWGTILAASDIQELLLRTGGQISDIKAADAERALACTRRPQQANPQEDDDGSQQTAEPEGDRGARASVGRR
jgi:TfuA protein